MTIKHFYMAAGYLLWSVLLLCIVVRLWGDRALKKREEKRTAAVEAWFCTPNPPGGLSARAEKELERCLRSHALFDHVAVRCREAMEQSTGPQRKAREEALVALIERKIALTAVEDAEGRCLILRHILWCGLTSRKIGPFVQACRAGSRLEQLWAEEVLLGHPLEKAV